MVKFTDENWDGAASNYEDTAAFCDACLINMNEGSREDWTQANCKLPVQEPGGAYNRNGIRNAMSRIFQMTGIPPATKQTAARKLLRLARAAGIEVGEPVKRLAGED